MGEEFQTEICGGNYWWNNTMNSTTRSVFPLIISTSSPCSVGGISCGAWQAETVDLKATATTRSCSDRDDSPNHTTSVVSVSDSSLGFLDATKPLLQHQTSGAGSTGNNNINGAIFMDSSLQMMGFDLSSSNWNHSPLSRWSGRSGESNFHNTMLQEETGTDSCGGNSQSQDQKRAISNMKQMMQQDVCGDFPLGSSSYGYPSSSTLIQSLYDIPQPQPQQSLFTNPPSLAYSSTPNYGAVSSSSSSSKELLSSSLFKPSGLHFSNSTPFWNASAETLHDIRADVFAPSSQPQQYQTSSLINEKPSFPSSLNTKPKREEEAPDSASVKKSSCEPAIKKQRIETPSPLPTFKVRKEKLGDRVTALQQLVSPFGKTDTASVLHEAIEYIKFLHDQVSVLSTPYMKNGAPSQHWQQGSDLKDSEGPKQDLRSRGLCLVPISSTFPVTNETTVEFWTPSFGGALIR